MNIESKYNKLFGFTPVSDIFITDYLPELDGVAAQIYLLCVYNCKMSQPTDRAGLAAMLKVSEAVIDEKMVELENIGLLVRIDDRIVLQDINQRELEVCYKSRTSGALEDEFSERGEVRERRSEVVKAISDRVFGGNMAPDWYQEISLFFSKYGFEPDVMLMLFQHCRKFNGLTKPYVRRVAEEWNRNGIRTADQLEDYLVKIDNYRDGRSKVAKKLGLSLPMDEYSEDMVKRWFMVYQYDMDTLEIAFKKAPGRRNPGIRYFDAIIRDWQAHDLKDKAAVEAYEEKRAAEKKAEAASGQAPAPGKSNRNNYKGREYDDAFLESLYKKLEDE